MNFLCTFQKFATQTVTTDTTISFIEALVTLVLSYG